MQFEWDSKKERANVRKHGVAGSAALGIIHGTERDVVRIINARPAEPDEHRDYEEKR